MRGEPSWLATDLLEATTVKLCGHIVPGLHPPRSTTFIEQELDTLRVESTCEKARLVLVVEQAVAHGLLSRALS